MKLFNRFLAGAVSAAIVASSTAVVMAAEDNITVRKVMKTDDTTLTIYLSEDCDFDISGYSFYLKEGDTSVAEDLSGTKISERRITVDVGASIEDDKDYTLEWYKDEYDEGSSFAFKTYYSFTNDATTVTSAGNIGWTCDAEGNYFLRPMKADGSQLADVTTTSNKVNDGAVISADFDSFGDKSCVISYDFTIQDSRIAFGFLAICNAYRDKLTNNYIKDGRIYIESVDTGLDLQETEDGWHSVNICFSPIKTSGISAKVYIDDVCVGTISQPQNTTVGSIRMYATTDGADASEFDDGTENYGKKTWIQINNFKFEGTNSPYYSSEYKVEADRWSHGQVKGPYRVYSGPSAINGYIITASYDENDIMINSNIQEIDMDAMDMIEYEYRETVQEFGNYIKVFIWDGVGTMKPVKDITSIVYDTTP